MKDNIKDVVSGTQKQAFNTIGSLNFPAPPQGDPEGGVKYYVGDVNLGSGIAGSKVFVSGKGTIIVDGNLTIRNGMEYSDSKSILGIIVRNGNVIVQNDVDSIVGIYYIFADGANGGQFIVRSKAPVGYDSQFVIKGIVIASGYKSGDQRVSAFVLNRTYIGDPAVINKDDPTTWQPAEVFEYDGRVIVSPPPAFSSQVFQVRD